MAGPDLPVELHDERFTTVIAERSLRRGRRCVATRATRGRHRGRGRHAAVLAGRGARERRPGRPDSRRPRPGSGSGVRACNPTAPAGRPRCGAGHRGPWRRRRPRPVEGDAITSPTRTGLLLAPSAQRRGIARGAAAVGATVPRCLIVLVGDPAAVRPRRRAGSTSSCNPRATPACPSIVDVHEGWGDRRRRRPRSPRRTSSALPLAFKIWATVTRRRAVPSRPLRHPRGNIGVRGAVGLPRRRVRRARQARPEAPAAARADARSRSRNASASSRATPRRSSSPVVNSGTIRSKYQPPEVNSLEGLLFPDTYFIGANESDESIVQQARRSLRRDRRQGRLSTRTRRTGSRRTRRSSPPRSIQTEAKLAEDAPLISAVIRNRLASGMPLQIDSTLCYAKGGCPPLPTNADKAIDSPYNTYKISGLPPTPIASVTEASLERRAEPGRRAVQVLRGRRREREARVRDDARTSTTATWPQARAKGLL